MTLIHSATAAYDKRAFELLHHMHEGVMNEDGVMSFYCIVMANASAWWNRAFSNSIYVRKKPRIAEPLR